MRMQKNLHVQTSLLPSPHYLHDHHIRQRIRVDPHNLKPLICLDYNTLPCFQAPLPCIEKGHHPQIRTSTELCNTPRHIRINLTLLAHVINEEELSTRLQRGAQLLHDLDGFCVGPVVQDHLEEVDVCGDRLRVEEVMLAEGDAGGEGGGDLGGEDGATFVEIFHGYGEGRVGGSQGEGVVAAGAADLGELVGCWDGARPGRNDTVQLQGGWRYLHPRHARFLPSPNL
jgi:hypothetical protein